MDHPRNQRIHLDEASHIYTLDGHTTLTSVTTVIEGFFPSFNPDEAIAKLKRKGTHPLANYEPEEIKKIWDDRGRESQEAGTHLHLMIEQHLKGQRVTQEPQVIGFVEELKRKKLGRMIASEWAIFDEEWGIAGTLDALFCQRDTYWLVDWKRSVIKRENRFENGHGPIRHLQACNFEKYSLQMSLYAMILKRRYGLEKANIQPLIIQLHPSQPYLAIDAANRSTEVAQLVDHFCQQTPAPRA